MTSICGGDHRSYSAARSVPQQVRSANEPQASQRLCTPLRPRSSLEERPNSRSRFVTRLSHSRRILLLSRAQAHVHALHEVEHLVQTVSHACCALTNPIEVSQRFLVGNDGTALEHAPKLLKRAREVLSTNGNLIHALHELRHLLVHLLLRELLTLLGLLPRSRRGHKDGREDYQDDGDGCAASSKMQQVEFHAVTCRPPRCEHLSGPTDATGPGEQMENSAAGKTVTKP